MADDFSQIAKDFIDRANGGTGPTGTWRLEVLQKRFSSNADREIPVRIRRFLKGIPWAHVHDAIRYLISQSPYTGIIYNGVELKGEYRPTLTQWRRDDQEQVGGNAQGSYTLIQDLIEVTDGDKLDTVSADSCSETEMTKWVWDAPEIEELPDNKGKQGETYAIRQVRRNEDGTFDYAIVRQVAKTKFSGWIVTECDDYSRVSVKVFDNVYGGLFDGDPFTDGTTVLPIPAPCETNDGTLVQVSVAQNPDCTFRVTVQKTEAKPNVEKTSETRKGLRGVVTSETTVATNPLPETGLELGEQVRNERRPDGLYDVTHVKVSKESVGDVGSSCGRTVFEHQHAETRNEAVRPEDEADFAGGGKTYQVQSRATEEGTWDVSRTTVTEQPVETAQHMMRKTLRGITETIVSRNVNNSEVSVSKIGDEVRIEQTPGGLWNRTETHASHEAVGVIGKACAITPVVHTDTVLSNVPDGSQPEPQHQSPEVNVEKTIETRRTEEGTWDVTDKTEVFSEAVATSETKWATETVRVTTRHHDTVKDRTVEGAFGETSSTPDDRGAANTTVVEYDPIPVDSGWIEWDSEVKSPSSVLKYRCGYRVFKNMEKPPPPGVGASDVDLNVSINRYGLYDGTIAYKKLVSWVRDGSGGGSGGIGTQTGWRRTGRYRPTENQYEWEQREVRVYEGSGNLSASTYAAEAKDSQVSGGGGYTVFTRVLQVKWGNKDSP